MQLTNANIKLLHSLDQARTRRSEGLFKVEGTKAVADTLGAFEPVAVYATAAYIGKTDFRHPMLVQATSRDMGRISSLTTPADIIAVYRIPESDAGFDLQTEASAGLVLALDTIQDPGNLGTIIRTADWFGICHIIASESTADVWAPKVVQATMGALARVRVHYCDLPVALAELHGVEIFGTFLDGENLYDAELAPTGVIVTGNEGRGISEAAAAAVSRRITIPSFGPHAAESLNAAVATAVTVAEFRRRTLTN